MENLGGNDFIKFVAIVVEKVAESNAVNFFVAFGDDIVELLSHKFSLGYFKQSAKPAADSINDQLEVVRMNIADVFSSISFLFLLEILDFIFDKAFFVVFYYSSDRKCFGAVVLTDTNFFHKFGCVFDYTFGVVFEAGCRNQVHRIDNS